MAAWWSPLSDGIQRLVARTPPPRPDAPFRAAAVVPPVRPPQVWAWQPPIQRAIDPTWQPGLRPNDFAAGLTSHQDPSLRRDLVHEVRPEVGGLVDGLADLVPGQPRIREATSELTVRPVRTARPEVQRTLASFASSTVGDELTTVEVDPPWLADPVTVAEPVGSAEPADRAVSISGLPVAPRPPASVPAGTPRDIRVQRGEADAAPRVGRPETPETPEVSDETVMPVAPTLARTSADRPTVARAVPTVDARTLPVVAVPPSARPARPELPTTRTLPVLQRSVVPEGSGPSPAWSRSEPSPSEPPRSEPPRSEPSATAPPAPEPSGTAPPAPEPSGTAPPAPPAPPEPGATAPLSGFAEAIERMSVEREPEPAPLQRVGQESVVAGPVVPTGRAASPGREVTAEGVWSPEPQAAFVQREVTAEAPAPSPPAAPAVGVEAPEAPLLGSRVEGVASAERSAQQTSYDDLPVVPVARGVELSQEWSGPDDVPRLAVATFAPPSVPSTGSIGSTGAIQASSHPHDASAVGSWPVVARAATTGTVPTVARAATTGNVPTGARAVEAPTRTASLTGTHPIVAQRAGVEPLQPVSTPALERVQPLRFEGLGGSTTTPTTTPTTTLPSPPAVPSTAVPSTADPSLATGPSLQRSSGSFPAVAPGLVGPGPVISGPVLPGPAAADPGPALSVVTFPAPGSAAVDLEPVTVSRTTDLPIWSPPAPAAPREGGTRPRTWAEQPVQRLAAPLPTAPTARPTTARSLSFDQMFGGTGAPGTSDADAGWTTVDLPVVTEGSASVQRAVDTAAITTEPAPAPTPEPSPAPAADGASSAAPAAPPAAAAPAPGGADLDEMARRLFDPLSARLKAELWLDRERAGLVADAHF